MNEEYKEYLKSNDWKEKRARELSGKRFCGICGAPTVDIHHLKYRSLFDVELSDLRRMCRRCHSLAHDLYCQRKIIFKNDNHQSRWVLIKSAVKKGTWDFEDKHVYAHVALTAASSFWHFNLAYRKQCFPDVVIKDFREFSRITSVPRPLDIPHQPMAKINGELYLVISDFRYDSDCHVL